MNRYPHWTPTPEWPYPFPPIRGGDGDHKGMDLVTVDQHTAFHNLPNNPREAARSTQRTLRHITKQSEAVRWNVPLYSTVSIREYTDTGLQVPNSRVDIQVMPGDPEQNSTVLSNPDGTFTEWSRQEGGNWTPSETFGTPDASTQITLTDPSGPPEWDPAGGFASPPGATEMVDPTDLNQLARDYQVRFPDSTIQDARNWAFDQLYGSRGGGPGGMTPYQVASLELDQQAEDRREREGTRDYNRAFNEFGARFIHDTARLAFEMDTTVRGLDQADQNLSLLEDQLTEETRSNRAREAATTRQQIEVEKNNQLNFQLGLQNLQARGNELIAQVQSANADRALSGAIAGATIGGQNADRLLAAAESQLNRSMQALSMGLQDDATRQSQRIQILDLAADAAQSPFDVVRQAAIATGLGGISGALARGESGLTEQGVAPLSGLLSEFQGLSGRSPLFDSALAQQAVSRSPVGLVPLPQLPAAVQPPQPFSGAGVLTGAGGLNQDTATSAADIARQADIRNQRDLMNAQSDDPQTAARARAALEGVDINDIVFHNGMFVGGTSTSGTRAERDARAEAANLALGLSAAPAPAGIGAAQTFDRDIGTQLIPALAGGGTTGSHIALVGEQGPELIFSQPGGGFSVLPAEVTKKLDLTGIPKAADGGIFGTSFEDAAGSATSGFDLLSFLRQQLVRRFQASGLPFTGRSGPIDVSAPGTPSESRNLLAGFQASAGINPASFLEEVQRITPPALQGGRQLRRTF